MTQSGALRLMLLLGNASLTPEEYQECFLQPEPPSPTAFNLLVSVQPCLYWKPQFSLQEGNIRIGHFSFFSLTFLYQNNILLFFIMVWIS